MKLRELAHSRAGDKGNLLTISVIAYRPEDYEAICAAVTHEAVHRHFSPVGITKVERYELPRLGALNFVLHCAPGEAVSRSLALDAHGKSYSSYMLEMDIQR